MFTHVLKSICFEKLFLSYFIVYFLSLSKHQYELLLQHLLKLL